MALSIINSGTYLPNCIGTWTTLKVDNSEGLKQFKIDMTNLPPGTIMVLSFQTKLGPDQPFLEFDSSAISIPVTIPAGPSQGHQPVANFEFNSISFGFQVQAQIINGTLPSKGLYWALCVIH